jgi:hypothetical protein
VNKQRGYIQIPDGTISLLVTLAAIGAVALICAVVGLLWLVVAHVDVVIK